VTTSRIEAFSDGVLAIIITIMVLGLRVPNGGTLSALRPLVPSLACYVLSFVYIGIYWNNHHHLLKAAERVTGGVLWANLNLLFWLSLVPFTTSWMAQNHFASAPVGVYGVVLLCAAAAYYVLQLTIKAANGPDSMLAAALGRDLKGKLSPVIYVIAVALSPFARWVSLGLYFLVAVMWLVPDRRLARLMVAQPEPS
jgi:uncharacterized membrane protein